MKTGIFTNPAIAAINPQNETVNDLVTPAKNLQNLIKTQGFSCEIVNALTSNEVRGLDALFVLGGDGTILRCAEICAREHVKIIGINYGTLGFLTEFERTELDSAVNFLSRLREGKTKEIQRNLLKVTFNEKSYYVLNEAAIRRNYSVKDGRMLKADVFVNDYAFDEISGDGVLVCTPTGSTAYSLSAGGPIIEPQTGAILLTPLCAFSLAARPAVLPQNDVITIQIKRGGAFLLADGVVVAKMAEGDFVRVELSTLCVAFPTRSFGEFYKKARKKLS